MRLNPIDSKRIIVVADPPPKGKTEYQSKHRALHHVSSRLLKTMGRRIRPLLPQLLVGPPLRIPSDDGGVAPLESVVPLARDGTDGQRQNGRSKCERSVAGIVAVADLAEC